MCYKLHHLNEDEEEIGASQDINQQANEVTDNQSTHTPINQRDSVIVGVDESFRCGECGKRFSRDLDLTSHLQTHVDVADKLFRCKTCRATFRSALTLRSHVRSHNTTRLCCHVCDRRFLSAAKLEAHLWNHADQRHTFFKCDICGKSYEQRYQLMVHKSSHGERLHGCQSCPKKFFLKFHMTRHALSCHAEEPRFKCDVCLMRFRLEDRLNTHMSCHKDRLTCGMCHVGFKSRDDWEHHISVHNSKVVSEGSETCPDPSEADLSVHQMTQADPAKTSVASRMVDNHVGQQSMEDPRTQKSPRTKANTGSRLFACNICNQLFNRQDNRRAHMRRHVDVSTKPFQCTTCDIGFSTKSHFTIHMLNHNIGNNAVQ